MTLYIAVDKNKEVWLYSKKPKRCHEYERWQPDNKYNYVQIPYYLVELLVGRILTWEDEPVKIEAPKNIVDKPNDIEQ